MVDDKVFCCIPMFVVDFNATEAYTGYSLLVRGSVGPNQLGPGAVLSGGAG